jgi:hypothetical protein
MLTLWFRYRDPAELHRSTRALRCRLPLPASIARACACADLRKALRPDPLGARNQIRATIGETATAPPPAAEPNAAAAGSPRAPSEAASLPESTLVGRGGFGKAAVARKKKSS